MFQLRWLSEHYESRAVRAQSPKCNLHRPLRACLKGAIIVDPSQISCPFYSPFVLGFVEIAKKT